MGIERLAHHHHIIVQRTTVVTTVSSESIFGLGQSLSAVLLAALQIERSMVSVVEGQSDAIEDPAVDLEGGLAERLGSASTLTHGVTDAVNRVGMACEALNHITSTCQILLMHTQIEGDRIRQSKSVHATSEQLSSFTTQMVDATVRADSVHYDLADLVDQLSHILAEMRRVVAQFSEGLARRLAKQHRKQVWGAQQFDDAVRTIRKLSQEIVSRSRSGVDALQFHDAAIQALQRLDSKFAELLEAAGLDGAPRMWGRRLGDPIQFTVDDERALRMGVAALRTDMHRRADGFMRDAERAVDVVREVIGDLAELVDAQAGASRRAVSAADSTDEVSVFLNHQLRELDRLTQRYLSVAVDGQGLCSHLLEVQTTILRVARRVEPPAQNLSLQASKAGKYGRPLAVIADEMVTVSRKVAQVGSRVVDSANAVQEILPQLEQEARAIAEHTREQAQRIRLAIEEARRQTVERATCLREALSVVQQLSLKVREARWSAVLHYGFVEAVRPALLDLKAAADGAFIDVEDGRDPLSELVESESAAVEAAAGDPGDEFEMGWMFDNETPEVDPGEFVLL